MKQQKIHNLKNRARRIIRRIFQLTQDREQIQAQAKRMGHEAPVGDILAQINRLKERQAELR